jgi:hypothetical protein
MKLSIIDNFWLEWIIDVLTCYWKEISVKVYAEKIVETMIDIICDVGKIVSLSKGIAKRQVLYAQALDMDLKRWKCLSSRFVWKLF